jgi:hypothetical protein
LLKFFNRPLLENKKFQIGLLIYLLLAPISYHLLPYMGFYGADVSMQYFYTHCSALAEHSANLFQLTGEMCNNANNSHYAYPVLIFRFFSFTKLFSNFELFYYFWTTLIALTIFVSPFVWLKKRNTKVYLGIAALSLIQAPAFYAMERGGTDIAFLIPWMIATYFGLKDKWIISGIFMAIAAFLKLYPAMAITPILIGLFLDKNDQYKSKFFKCGITIAVVMVIVFSLDWHLWKVFLFDVLPIETKHHIGTNAIGHSLIGPFSKIFVYPIMVVLWVLYAKVFALKYSWNKKFAFAGVLAMSTYFNNHSFDYNLITALPFIYLCFELYFAKESPLKSNPIIMWAILILCFTILGPANYIFSFSKYIIRFKLLIELVAFFLIPIAILSNEKLIQMRSTES